VQRERGGAPAPHSETEREKREREYTEHWREREG
jgi:hypothetical protein